MIINQDLAPTFLDLAGLPVHPGMHGASFRGLACGNKPANWRTSFLSIYRKEPGDTPTCHAIRTADAKLIIYPNKPDRRRVRCFAAFAAGGFTGGGVAGVQGFKGRLQEGFEAVEGAFARQCLAAILSVAAGFAEQVWVFTGGCEQGSGAELFVVVEVFVTEGKSEDSLADHDGQRVFHEARVAGVGESAGELVAEAGVAVGILL